VRADLHLDRYDDRLDPYPWLAKIGTRLAQNWPARRARALSREGGEDPEALADTGSAGPLDQLLADEAGKRLWQAVAALPVGERTAIYLCYRQGMSVLETARACGVTSGTVKTWLFRARKKLRPQLTGHQRSGEESN
jgi:RNA polymerase sigma-70 factor, ECF subfamily